MPTILVDGEEESVLDESEQTNRPLDVAFQQQRVAAWHPILHPEWMIYSFLILAVIMIPVGFRLETLSNEIVEIHRIYDGPDKKDQLCPIHLNYNADDSCTIQFTAHETLHPPILIYYELTNFHQNHRSYAFSRDDYQLHGKVGGQDAVSATACQPINKLGNMTINPCGKIANTFFNDKFTLTNGTDQDGNDLFMDETGIAWKSDIEHRFAMPDGYQEELCEGPCDASCCTDKGFSCKVPDNSSDGCYAYDYPEDDTTQYLYETYPNIISPREHVTNEHFIVWMRVATRPKFRKLYGHIDQVIPQGNNFTMEINLNYVVEGFGGTKAIIISTNSIVGGKNPYLGQTFYYMGFFCLFCGVFFATNHWFLPRKIADRKYLHYKDD